MPNRIRRRRRPTSVEPPARRANAVVARRNTRSTAAGTEVARDSAPEEARTAATASTTRLPMTESFSTLPIVAQRSGRKPGSQRVRGAPRIGHFPGETSNERTAR